MKNIFLIIFGSIVFLNAIDMPSVSMPSMMQSYMKSGSKIMKNGVNMMSNMKDTIIQKSNQMMNMGKKLERKMFKLYKDGKLFSFNLRKDNIYVMDITPNGRYLVVGTDDSIVKIWDLWNGQIIKEIKVKKYLVDFIKITPDGKSFITTSDNNNINLWDLKTGKLLKTFHNGSNEGLVNIIILTNKNQLISGDDSSLVKVWSMKTGKLLKTFHFKTGMVTALAVTDNGNIIAGNDDSTIKMWNIKTGKLIGYFKGSNGLIRNLFISSNKGKYLISIDDTSIRIWNIKKRKNIKTLFFPYRVSSVRLTPDGKNLIISDNGFKILQIDTGKMTKIIESKNNYVDTMNLTPDNKYILTFNDDKSINIWSIKERKKLAKYISFINNEWVSFKSDAHYTSSNNADKYIYLKINNKKVPLYILRKKLKEKAIKLK